MTDALNLLAPAKLNLFLHVTGRRLDGYHTLQTLFTFVSLFDEVTLHRTDDGKIHRVTEVPGVPEDQDLSVRAARLLKESAGTGFGVNIALKKRIPLGGGLGGGSSDAATVLLGLNVLWALHWPREVLARLGLRLGADVPVFVMGQSAWAEGVGESLTPFPVPDQWYVLLFPPVSVPTSLIFNAPELTRNTPRTTMSGFSVGEGRNDLEPVVCGRFPQVNEALQWLKQFGAARMTGSGSSVFVGFSDENDAKTCFRAKPSGWAGWLVQGLQDHPLKNWP